jgi:hypothetical protein
MTFGVFKCVVVRKWEAMLICIVTKSWCLSEFEVKCCGLQQCHHLCLSLKKEDAEEVVQHRKQAALSRHVPNLTRE